MSDDIIATGSGTHEDPDSYVVNEALLDAIERGRWNTTMLSALVRFARTALRPNKDCVIRRDGGPKCGCVVKDGVVTDWCRREIK